MSVMIHGNTNGGLSTERRNYQIDLGNEMRKVNAKEDSQFTRTSQNQTPNLNDENALD